MNRYNSLGTTLTSADGIIYQSGIPYAVLEYPGGNFQFHEVLFSETGRLDLIAYKWFNDCSMWEPIAVLNNIIDPLTEVCAGRVLAIPKTPISINTYVASTYPGT